MLQIDLWKRIVIWGLCIIGLFLALPNAFYTRVEGYNDTKAGLISADAAQDGFCGTSACVIVRIFDQSPLGNHLAPPTSSGATLLYLARHFLIFQKPNHLPRQARDTHIWKVGHREAFL